MSEGVSLCVGPGPAAVLTEGEEEARRGGSLDPSLSMTSLDGRDKDHAVREKVTGCGRAMGDKGEDLRDQALLHTGILHRCQSQPYIRDQSRTS